MFPCCNSFTLYTFMLHFASLRPHIRSSPSFISHPTCMYLWIIIVVNIGLCIVISVIRCYTLVSMHARISCIFHCDQS